MARGNPWVQDTGGERFFLGVLPSPSHQPFPPPQPARPGLVLPSVQHEGAQRAGSGFEDGHSPCSVDEIGARSQCSLEQIYQLLRINYYVQQWRKPEYIHVVIQMYG